MTLRINLMKCDPQKSTCDYQTDDEYEKFMEGKWVAILENEKHFNQRSEKLEEVS